MRKAITFERTKNICIILFPNQFLKSVDCYNMPSVDIDGRKIGSPDEDVFFIAEIGQNHQGNLKVAKQMILEAKRIGCDCVKFQKSDLNAKFTKTALERVYISKDSWGETYGDHKRFLEFSIEEYKELQEYADTVGILFTASAMDEQSLEMLDSLKVPFIKIGSGDANNFKLLKKAAQLQAPLIISTGMQTINTVKEIARIMEVAQKTNFALMHCVSSYPTSPNNCRLKTIPLLQKMFPNVHIGYSGHEIGIEISSAAINLGARIIERHFTLGKGQKGSDHKCSLLPEEFEELIHRTRLGYQPVGQEVSVALEDIEDKIILDCEMNCRNKLGKSLVYKRALNKDDVIQEDDISVKVSEPFGITGEQVFEVIGKVLKRNVREDDNVYFTDFFDNIC
ncbi:NANS family protein [Megaselia abdita]